MTRQFVHQTEYGECTLRCLALQNQEETEGEREGGREREREREGERGERG